MRFHTMGLVVVVAVALAFSTTALAQDGQGRGRTAPAPSATSNLPFDAHDFSGVWMGVEDLRALGKPPAMTAWAQAKYAAAKPGIGPRAQPLGNDPMMVCDPIGYPRVAFYNAYPMEFVQTKDRLIEFFDFFYAHRTIWLDGRALPADPEPSWYGYSVGHWDGNTLVVETTGFNDESWLDQDGHPHSDQLRLEERFTRVDHDTIQAHMTMTDPKAYVTPWVTGTTTWRLSAKQAMREDLCAPSDEEKYKDEVREPAAAKK